MVEPSLRALDEKAAQQGLQHAISMTLGGKLKSMDLGVDPALTQPLLGFAEDNVIAAIHETMDYILAHG